MTACINIVKCFGENLESSVQISLLIRFGLQRLKLSNKEISYIITHINDFEELFPGSEFIRYEK